MRRSDADQKLQQKKSITYVAPQGIPAAFVYFGAEQGHCRNGAHIKKKQKIRHKVTSFPVAAFMLSLFKCAAQ